MKTALITPARYGSTRFPGKPLAMIAGKTMLERVVEIGRHAAETSTQDITLLVATESQKIADHCKEIGVDCIITSEDCPTGSDRILEAAQKTGETFDFIIGLQGDAPFTPLNAIPLMLSAIDKNPDINVITPAIQLRWEELDSLRKSKETTPFSGTTVTIDRNGKALWFSKNIIPAIRGEEALREIAEQSPVHQHLGLYGYRTETLERFVSLPQSPYEKIEGLEQLRLLENNIDIHTVILDVDAGTAQTGVDSPEDIVRAEQLLKT